MKIAFIGTGVMGSAMAANLKKAGHDLFLYDCSEDNLKSARDNMNAFPEGGVKACPSIADAVKDADATITIVGFPSDVEEVYLGEGGIFAEAKEGSLAIDMTTSLPSLAEKLYTEGAKKGIAMLDAPVSGGDSGARAGSLSIMVGGDKEAFDRAKEIFQAMGKNIVYMGKAGNGQHTKAANQIAVAGATAAYSEALHYANKVGLDPEEMLKAIGSGAAGSWQLENMAPRALAGDFDPGFFVKHFIKDMKIIKREMDDREDSLPVLDKVLEIYQDFADEGHEDSGTQALILHYEPEKEED